MRSVGGEGRRRGCELDGNRGKRAFFAFEVLPDSRDYSWVMRVLDIGEGGWLENQGLISVVLFRGPIEVDHSLILIDRVRECGDVLAFIFELEWRDGP